MYELRIRIFAVANCIANHNRRQAILYYQQSLRRKYDLPPVFLCCHIAPSRNGERLVQRLAASD
jgi:hypothetical protein